MNQSPLIETPRLILKTPTMADVKPLNYAINSSLDELQKFMPWANDPSLATTRKFVEESIKQWGSKEQKNFHLLCSIRRVTL